MEGLSFKLLNHLKTLSETCPKHPNVHMKQLLDKKPFCPQCSQEEIDSKNIDISMSGIEMNYEDGFHGVLMRRSIWDDPEMKLATFENYDVDQGSEAYENKQLARKLAGRYLDRSYKANTILTGVPGVGKTHLAVSMVKAVNENIAPSTHCLFVSVNEMVRQVKQSFNDKSSRFTESYVTRLCGSVNLLVLDDLGSEASFKSKSNEASDWVQQLLFGILNKRSGRTIITTNLNSEQLTTIYNPKILSRIYRGVGKANGIIKFTEATADKRKDLF